MSLSVFCRYCGQQISDIDLVCDHCDSKQNFTVVSNGSSRKNSEGVIAFVVCFFFGVFGIHRFIYGKIGTGFLMLITLGGFGIWWLIDLIRIAVGHFTDSKGNHLSLIHNH
ncbi:MAG: TM2 domain-containing protein [Colwellia sp.]|nr:TM2 domain-containing protein [Colwellia sp.]